MEKLTIFGNVGSEPEPKQIHSGDTVIEFSLAVQKSKDKTVWYKCTKWLKSGENWNVLPYIKKGSKLIIEGVPGFSVWINNQTNKAQGQMTCTILQVYLAGSKADTQQSEPAKVQPTPEQKESGDWVNETEEAPF